MFNGIIQKFKLQNIVGKFIYVNVAVYIIVVLIGIFRCCSMRVTSVGRF